LEPSELKPQDSEPASDSAVPTEAPQPWRIVLAMVGHQGWGLCVAYLAVGLVVEVARRMDAAWAFSAQEFLDGLPFYALRATGTMDAYLRASAVGALTPLWNRLLLSGITLGAILLQAALLGGLLAASWALAVRWQRMNPKGQ